MDSNTTPNVLLIAADETVRQTLSDVVRRESNTQPNIQVTIAATEAEALNLQRQNKYDGVIPLQLLPDPNPSRIVLNAARAANPAVVTAFLNCYPTLDGETLANMHGVQQIFVNPNALNRLIPQIRDLLAAPSRVVQPIQSVAAILERATPAAIDQWYTYAGQNEALMTVKLTRDQRCAWLQPLFRELTARLISDRPLGSKSPVSTAAVDHGATRFQQRYTAPMLVEESRLLRQSIFNTLENNQASLDYPALFPAINQINDELDSQLQQAMESYTRQAGQQSQQALQPGQPVQQQTPVSA